MSLKKVKFYIESVLNITMKMILIGQQKLNTNLKTNF